MRTRSSLLNPNPNPMQLNDDDDPKTDKAPESPHHADTTDPLNVDSPGSVQLTEIAVRRPTGSRKKKPHRKLKAKQRKLEALLLCLQPVRFSPGKTLSYFAQHERVLRRHGLWDFACLDLDSDLRADYIASLVACYDPSHRASTVGNVRIRVSRADLSRALRIPLKKDRNASETVDADSGLGEPIPEDLSVVKEFMMNWIFVNSEDTLVIPDEITAAARLLDSGESEKIDWAGLVWSMAEKELSQGSALSTCYYAPHFQTLIRSQRPQLFELMTNPIAEATSHPVEAVGTTIEEVEEEEDDATKADGVEMEQCSQENKEIDQEKKETENYEINHVVNEEKKDDLMKEAVNQDEKRVGQDGQMNHFMKDENQMVIEDGEHLVVEDGGHEEVSHQLLLRHCTSNEIGRSTVMSEKLDETAFPNFEQLHSMGAALSMDGNLGLVDVQAVQSILPQPVETAHHQLDQHYTNGCHHQLDQHYTNGPKREFEGDDHILHNEVLKKIRNDHSQWGTNFNECMNQMTVWMNRAREIHTEKHESLVHAHLNLKSLDAGLRERDLVINALQENQYKMSNDLTRLRFELYATVNLAQAYKKLLDDTRKAFCEYRRRCPQLDEPLFKNVSGGGGLLLTSEELTKHLLEKEEEAKASFRQWAVEKFDEFSEHCEARFSMLQRDVHLREERISNLESEFKLLKSRFSQSRAEIK